jgi:hypothetical protein
MPDLVTVHYDQTGASQKTNQYGMREMQSRAYDARNSQYLLVKAPPASGKSRALMFIGLDKIANQGLKKVIVAVPERSIGSSFGSTVLTDKGFFADWHVEPKWNLTVGAGTHRGKAFAEFMSSDDSILVCTHSALRSAYDDLGAAAFADCAVAVDEFHHSSADVTSRLGELVRGLMLEGHAHIIAMTGSYFRGDSTPVLRPEDEALFTRITYTYYEQLNGYDHLKTLGIGYNFYRGRYLGTIAEVLDTRLKTIIHIPHIASAESSKDKFAEVDHISDAIGEYVRTDETTGFDIVRDKHGIERKVANLVDDGVGRERIMASLRDVKDKDAVDIIIALGMAKEGFDWIWCEHVLTVGYRGSLTEIVQIIGRATRDAVGKQHAQFTNLIAEPDASEGAVSTSVNNMLKAIACSLLMEQVLAPNFKFKTRLDTDQIDGTRRESTVILTGEQATIAIRGFIEAATPRAQQILLTDLNDLTAAVLQDDTVMHASLNPQEFPPEVINQVFVPAVIERKYPDLTPEEVEQVRQTVVANTVLKSTAGEIEHKDGMQFIRLAEKFINIDDLSIDLIDSINPFQLAYAIMSKSIDADVLKTIHSTIASTRITMTEDEAVLLWPRIEEFTKQNGKEPNLNSPDAFEKRMAEALIWIKNKAKQRMAEKAASL